MPADVDPRTALEITTENAESTENNKLKIGINIKMRVLHVYCIKSLYLEFL